MEDPLLPAPGTPGAGPGRGARPPLRVWVWTAATLAVVVVAGLLWRGSDAAATSSTTAPAPVAVEGSLAADLGLAWTARPSGPQPRRAVESGRVVLAVADGVRALDPVTGEEAWHYTRSNARLCDTTAVNGLVLAVFSTGGRCNEIVALTAATGVRAWARTIGFRPDVALASTDRIVLASSPTGLATIDPAGNNVRWRYEVPEGCRLTGADVGSTGVVALQRCTGSAGLQVLLMDGFAGGVTWTRELPDADGEARLVGVDRLVDVVVGDTLQVLSPTDGTQLARLPLGPATAGPAEEPLQQAGIADVALVWVRGTVYALDQSTGAVRWSVPATGLPSVGGDGGTVVVPEAGAFVRRTLADGAEVARSTAPADVAVGGRASLVGPVVVHSTADEVAGYR